MRFLPFRRAATSTPSPPRTRGNTMLLFVYGTLHPERAPAELRQAVSRFTEIGPATIAGVLHDLGEYPGVTPTTRRDQRVPGTLFALPDDPALLAELDAYEGFDSASPGTSLFVRLSLTAALADGSRKKCWVYLYNRAPPYTLRSI